MLRLSRQWWVRSQPEVSAERIWSGFEASQSSGFVSVTLGDSSLVAVAAAKYGDP